MYERINNLIQQQEDIQSEIRGLLEKEREITRKIISILNEKDKTDMTPGGKNLLKKQIKEMGFSVSSILTNKVRLLKLEKDNNIIHVVITQAIYREGTYNAWYTLKPNVTKKADFIIFLYSDYLGEESFIVIDAYSLKDMMENINSMPDGRTNIQLKADHKKAIEVQSRVDLSEQIGKLDLLYSKKNRRF